MFDENRNPVLIDFDSCVREGGPLGHKKGTYGWYDEALKVSKRGNDLAALDLIEKYLHGEKREEWEEMLI